MMDLSAADVGAVAILLAFATYVGKQISELRQAFESSLKDLTKAMREDIQSRNTSSIALGQSLGRMEAKLNELVALSRFDVAPTDKTPTARRAYYEDGTR